MTEKKISMSKCHPEIKIFGDIAYRGKCASEIVEQVTFFDQIRQTSHIAMSMKNEGKRTQQQYGFDVASGLLTGAADIHIVGVPPFYCELKIRHFTKAKTTQKQVDFLLNAQKKGAFVCYALGFEAALDAVATWEVQCSVHEKWLKRI